MAELPDANATGAAPALESAQHNARPGPTRLTQALMWVGIVAGTVFVVALIFFSGLFLGWSSGGHYGTHDGGGGRTGPGTHMGPGGTMGPGGMTCPGGMMGPGGSGTSSPSTPKPSSRP